MMRLALPHMKDRPGAAVINVASISGWSPQLAMSGQYGAAKAALIFGTERWALEFVPYGIRVNTVSPGSILVEGNGWDRYRLANPGYFEDYIRHGFGRSRPSPHQSAAGGAAGGVARPGDQSPSLPAAAPPAPHQGSRHGHRRDRSGGRYADRAFSHSGPAADHHSRGQRFGGPSHPRRDRRRHDPLPQRGTPALLGWVLSSQRRE